MNKKQHLYGGFLTSITLLIMSYYYNNPIYGLIDGIIFVLGVTVMSIIPDIDTDIGKHRASFHNLFVFVVISIILFKLTYILFLYAWGVAYLSHISLDILTKRGIALLYPLSNRRFGGLGIDAKSPLGNIVTYTVSITLGLFLIYVINLIQTI